jgi:hypothetical protein
LAYCYLWPWSCQEFQAYCAELSRKFEDSKGGEEMPGAIGESMISKKRPCTVIMPTQKRSFLAQKMKSPNGLIPLCKEGNSRYGWITRVSDFYSWLISGDQLRWLHDYVSIILAKIYNQMISTCGFFFFFLVLWADHEKLGDLIVVRPSKSYSPWFFFSFNHVPFLL